MKTEVQIIALSPKVFLNSNDHTLSGCPSITFNDGDFYTFVAFDYDTQAGTGVFEVNYTHDIENNPDGNIQMASTISEVAALVEKMGLPFAPEDIQAFREHLKSRHMVGLHLA